MNRPAILIHRNEYLTVLEQRIFLEKNSGLTTIAGGINADYSDIGGICTRRADT